MYIYKNCISYLLGRMVRPYQIIIFLITQDEKHFIIFIKNETQSSSIDIF